jgi:hypothetical protein
VGYIHRSRILQEARKIYIWGSKSPKTEFGAQNQYVRVIYPSIGNFTRREKKYTLGGQKDENRPPGPKNGIWGPKSVWSCDLSIDREFYKKREKIYFRGSKRRKKAPEAQKRNLGPQMSLFV